MDDGIEQWVVQNPLCGTGPEAAVLRHLVQNNPNGPARLDVQPVPELCLSVNTAQAEHVEGRHTEDGVGHFECSRTGFSDDGPDVDDDEVGSSREHAEYLTSREFGDELAFFTALRAEENLQTAWVPEENIVKMAGSQLFDDPQEVNELSAAGNVEQNRRIGLLQVQVDEDDSVVGPMLGRLQCKVQCQSRRPSAALGTGGNENPAPAIQAAVSMGRHDVAQNRRPPDSAFDKTGNLFIGQREPHHTASAVGQRRRVVLGLGISYDSQNGACRLANTEFANEVPLIHGGRVLVDHQEINRALAWLGQTMKQSVRGRKDLADFDIGGAECLPDLPGSLFIGTDDERGGHCVIPPVCFRTGHLLRVDPRAGGRSGSSNDLSRDLVLDPVSLLPERSSRMDTAKLSP